ncbi:MAG: ArsR/SmtB family transcription factor [Candidatus Odinarchaeia archaeon]
MKEEDVCEIKYVNVKAVEEVRAKMLEDSLIIKAADIFKILGDPTRVKILYALIQRELCVCDLSALLNMTHSAVSHQLRVLRAAKLVKFRKEGKNVYYSLSDDHVVKLIKIGVEHAKEQ